MSNPYVDAVAADLPIHWWRMEETSGSTVEDSAGNLDGTVVGASLDHPSATDNLGSAVSFDGVDDYIETNYTPNDTDLSNGASVELWVYQDTNVGSGDQFAFGSWGEPRFYIGDAQANGYQVGFGDAFANDAAFSRDGWHYLAFTNDGQLTRVYRDAVEVYTFSSSWSGSNSNTAHIGRVNGDGREFGGTIDEVAIYDYALSPSRIQAHYDAAFATEDPANLQATVDGDTVSLSWDASPLVPA